MALHAAQHDGQRRRSRERHQRQHPVVRQHHAGDHHHQRAIQQPGERPPREELRKRLDVARDAGDESTFALLAVVGEAQSVDVLEEPHTQAVQRLLTALAETGDCGALSDGGNDDHSEPDQPEDHDHADVDLVLLQPPVDCLLHQDRHDNASGRTDHRQAEGCADPASQCRSRIDALSDHLHRRPAAQRLRHGTTSVCSARSCSNASINLRYAGTITSRSSCRPWATT